MEINIISLVKFDGKWVEQDKIPEENMNKILERVMMRAGDAAGWKIQKRVQDERT